MNIQCNHHTYYGPQTAIVREHHTNGGLIHHCYHCRYWRFPSSSALFICSALPKGGDDKREFQKLLEQERAAMALHYEEQAKKDQKEIDAKVAEAANKAAHQQSSVESSAAVSMDLSPGASSRTASVPHNADVSSVEIKTEVGRKMDVDASVGASGDVQYTTVQNGAGSIAGATAGVHTNVVSVAEAITPATQAGAVVESNVDILDLTTEVDSGSDGTKVCSEYEWKVLTGRASIREFAALLGPSHTEQALKTAIVEAFPQQVTLPSSEPNNRALPTQSMQCMQHTEQPSQSVHSVTGPGVSQPASGVRSEHGMGIASTPAANGAAAAGTGNSDITNRSHPRSTMSARQQQLQEDKQRVEEEAARMEELEMKQAGKADQVPATIGAC